MLGRKKPVICTEETPKVLDVDASMQGNLTFKDPVNLRINGNFEGMLDTRGSLTIGEKASVKANVIGESILIAGEVVGDVRAQKEVRILATGRLVGDLETPVLTVEPGAVLQGQVRMISAGKTAAPSRMAHVLMNVDELAAYLAVEKTLIFEWADGGKLPAIREGSGWMFEKSSVDEWVASGRIK